MKTLERARRETDAGRPWRAKEILRGAIGQSHYDLRLYRAYGELLLQMGDLPEAGKYLFLSGSSAALHQDAVSEFLRRWAKNGPHLLYSRFPSNAKLQSVRDYPRSVQEVLTEGFKPPLQPVVEPCCPPSRAQQVRDAISLFGCGAVVFILFACLLFGIYSFAKLMIES